MHIWRWNIFLRWMILLWISPLKLNASTHNNYLRNVILMFKYNIPKQYSRDKPQWITKTSIEEIKKNASVRKAGLMWTYLKTPSAGYIVKHQHVLITYDNVHLSHTRGMLYKSVAQMVLLYESDSWVVMVEMLKVLEVFHHRAAQKISAMTARHAWDGEW